MTVALIAESGIRFMDLPVLLDEIRVSVARGEHVHHGRYLKSAVSVTTYRRFVKMDEHTYVEKD